GRAVRHAVVGQVGNRHQPGRQFLLHFAQVLFERLQLAGNGLGLRQHGRRVLTTRLQLAYLLGKRIAARLQLLGLDLHGLAAGFQGMIAVDIEGQAAAGERPHDAIQVLAQQIGVEHGEMTKILERGYCIQSRLRPGGVALRGVPGGGHCLRKGDFTCRKYWFSTTRPTVISKPWLRPSPKGPVRRAPRSTSSACRNWFPRKSPASPATSSTRPRPSPRSRTWPTTTPS